MENNGRIIKIKKRKNAKALVATSVIDYKEEDFTKNGFTSMMRLVSLLDPNFDSKKIMEFYKRYNQIHKKSLDQIQRKIGEIQGQVYEANIDPNDVQRFYTLLNQINPEYVKLFNEILESIKIKLW